jgi:prephenate dehydrogenase
MQIDTLTIVGVGLIGGSVGLAARSRQVVRRIIGVDRHAGVLERAVQNGSLDEGSLDLAAATAAADLVVVSTPVDQIAAQVVAAADSCRPGTLVTDAGSTKAAIVREVANHMPPGVSFVGSHPLAGSEKNGPDHATAYLFLDRVIVVTPGENADELAVNRVCAFWRALGGRVQLMDADAHDRAMALTSHLPHLVASALAGILPAELHMLTATGFRDMTRLAAGQPALWRAILQSNQEAVLGALDRLDGQVERFREALLAGDANELERLLWQGQKVRNTLPP